MATECEIPIAENTLPPTKAATLEKAVYDADGGNQSFFWGGRSSSSKEVYRPRRRRVIAHGHCSVDDVFWKPHFMAMEPQYTVNGPDWQSSLRCLHPTSDETSRNEDIWPERCSHLRTYPGSSQPSVIEWTYYTKGFSNGKKCYFSDVHLRSVYGADEVSNRNTMGCRRKLNNIDVRNGIYNASSGDNIYQAAEYEVDFHKKGSTRPIVNFGHAFVKKTHTFIPLTPLPDIPCEPYIDKEKRRCKQFEVDDVGKLDNWKAAQPLTLQSLMESPVAPSTVRK